MGKRYHKNYDIGNGNTYLTQYISGGQGPVWKPFETDVILGLVDVR